jgi:hypothetical protein
MTTRWTVAVLVLLAAEAPATATPQGSPLTVEQLAAIFGSGGDIAGWDEYQVPQFVAEYYGRRATDAIAAILRMPTTRTTYYVQLEALTAAGYDKLSVDVSLIEPFARGDRVRSLPPAMAEVFQHRALMALTGRPSSGLSPFWDSLQNHPSEMVRQYAVMGLACSIGPAALDRIAPRIASDTEIVSLAAQRADSELRSRGRFARVCYGLPRDSASTLPNRVSEDLLARARRYLGRLP